MDSVRGKQGWEDFAAALVRCVQSGGSFDVAVHEPAHAMKQDRAYAMRDKLEKMLPGAVVLCEDLADHSDFGSLIHAVIERVFDKLPGEASEAEETQELWDTFEQGDADPDDLKGIFQCLMQEALAETQTPVILILARFELSAAQWGRHDYGYMRAMSAWRNPPSVILYSDRPICAVSEMPDGNSPYYNIFEEYGTILTELAYD